MAEQREVAERLAELYAPIAARIVERARVSDSGVVVGVCGPQGSGKSTGAAALRKLLEAKGSRAVTLSLDDLYLGRSARLELAARVHPLLATRGPPGTHDTGLGMAVLSSLMRRGATVMPRFDKAIDDRRNPTGWPSVAGPVDVVIFEGWCVGARPQPMSALLDPVNDLEARSDPDGVWRAYVNEALARDYQALFAGLSFQILLSPPSFEVVAGWRIQQEHDLRLRRPDGAQILSDDQVRQFVKVYERLTRHLLQEMPSRADVVIRLDEHRNPITA